MDQSIIAWFKAKNILKDVNVNIIWSDPEGMDIASVEIEVTKTTDTEKYRIIWSDLHFSIVNILKKSFGRWKVRLLENSKIIKEIEFEVKDINSVHEQIIGSSVNLSI